MKSGDFVKAAKYSLLTLVYKFVSSAADVFRKEIWDELEYS